MRVRPDRPLAGRSVAPVPRQSATMPAREPCARPAHLSAARVRACARATSQVSPGAAVTVAAATGGGRAGARAPEPSGRAKIRAETA